VATAPPSSQLDESVLFAQQVDSLVKTHLSDEGKYVFSHFTQAHGFLLLSAAICRLHGGDKAGFRKFADVVWKEAEESFIVEEQG
jgi:hypothetical protein